MKELPSIAKEILEKAFWQLEDADYHNYARVVIGHDQALVDRDEFYELKEFLSDKMLGTGELKEFEDVVNEKIIFKDN